MEQRFDKRRAGRSIANVMTGISGDPPVLPAPGAVRPAVRAALVAGGLCLAILLPLILAGYDHGRGAADQRLYHLPTILHFADQLPRPDLRDYQSATTPGYHLALAAVARWISSKPVVLRLAGSLCTLGLVLLLAGHLGARAGAAWGVLLTLPLLVSPYVVAAGAWVLPDNAGWLGVLAALLLALSPRRSARWYALTAVVVVLLVLVRQSQIWVLLPVLAGGTLLDDNRRRGLVGALLAGVPAVAVTAAFILHWGGTTPPGFQGQYAGAHPVCTTMLLMLAGGAGLFFLPLLAGRVPTGWVSAAIVGAVIGLLAGVLPETSYSYADGRYSGVWNIIRHLPVVAQRSPVVILLATLGGGLLGVWTAALGRWGTVWLTAWIGLAAATSYGSPPWQRYFEPLVLMLWALAAAQVLSLPAGGRVPVPRWAWMGPAVLSLLLALTTVQRLRPGTSAGGDERPAGAGQSTAQVVPGPVTP
jgi:hypothetical protein